MDGRLRVAYGEEAFGYLLSIEQARSERSGRTFFLLLVDVTEPSGASARIDPTIAERLFVRLQSCLRETDFVGWYREGRVAGAVLTESRSRLRADVDLLVGERVRDALCECFPAHVAGRLRVCVHQYPESASIEAPSMRTLGSG